jgi:outer membrane protein assembly factor BamB
MFKGTPEENVMRNWSLWIGASLLVLFAVFAFFMYRYFLGRFERNADRVADLAVAEFLEDAVPSSPDWPQWRGVHRDGHAKPFVLASEWPPRGPKPAWTVPVGAGCGAPAVVGGRVFLHTQEDGTDVTRCLDLASGEEVWKQTSSGSGQFEHTHGPSSSPCVAGGKLYTVGLTGLVQCRATADGKLLWEKDLRSAYGVGPPRWGVAFSPLVEGNRLILNPGAGGAAVVACQADTGDEIWRWGSDPAGYSSPLVATIGKQRLVIMFTGKALAGLRLEDGKEVFRYPWATDYQVNPAMPIVFRTRQGNTVRDYVFITSGYGQGCGLLHLHTRIDNTIAVEPVYTADNFCSHFGSPVRIGDHVYGFHEAELIALNLRTGEIDWRQSGFKKGNVCALGDELVVLGEEGKVAIGVATPDQPLQPRLETKLPQSRHEPIRYWTMPIVADGRLLIRSGDNAVCIDLRAEH